MFNLGSIFMVNDSLELSVIFVPLVLAEQTPTVEVFLETCCYTLRMSHTCCLHPMSLPPGARGAR